MKKCGPALLRYQFIIEAKVRTAMIYMLPAQKAMNIKAVAVIFFVTPFTFDPIKDIFRGIIPCEKPRR